MGIVKQRMPWRNFALKAVLVSLVAAAAVLWFKSRFMVGYDPQIVRCFPDHEMFLVDTARIEPERGSILAYRAKGLLPFFEDGTLMAKVVQGLPGDHLKVTEDGVFINGAKVAEGFMHEDRLQLTSADLARDEIIPPDHYLMLAPAPESYDGRYWGYVEHSQLVGNVFPLI